MGRFDLYGSAEYFRAFDEALKELYKTKRYMPKVEITIDPKRKRVTSKRVRRFKLNLPRYEIYQNHAGQWCWRYRAKNGKEIARQSETVTRLRTVERAVQIMKTSGAADVAYLPQTKKAPAANAKRKRKSARG